MSSEPRLEFSEVTKSFRDRTAPRTLRDAIPSALGMLLGSGEPARTRFVALDGVSFAIAPGEGVGVIGRNGAGKSTTLKLAAGIYRPDSGAVTVRGRVASMIELSAGFHPDLSGRENVYLNGALLGLRRNAITALLPRILEFAGIGDFIEAPLRIYSSGMVVRLGFAVAAHVPAELMLVDEVLAVGDIDFRTRCMDRMAERRREGVSVLMVSHNLVAVERFCDRVLVIEGGRKAHDGEPVEVIDAYRRMMLQQPADGARKVSDLRRGTGEVTIERVEIAGEGPEAAVLTGRPVTLRLHLRAEHEVPAPTFGVTLLSPEGSRLVVTRSAGDEPGTVPLPRGDSVAEVRFDSMDLLPGAYLMHVYVRDREGVSDYDLHLSAYRLLVEGERPEGALGQVALGASWTRPGA